jgi:hypothetical protein
MAARAERRQADALLLHLEAGRVDNMRGVVREGIVDAGQRQRAGPHSAMFLEVKASAIVA